MPLSTNGATLDSFISRGCELWWFFVPRKSGRMFFYLGFPILFCAGWLFFKVPQIKGTKIIATSSLLLTLAMCRWMPWEYVAVGPIAIIKYIQFPWRMLSVTVSLLCILSAYNARLYFTDKNKPRALLAISCACTLAMLFIFPSARVQPLYPKEADINDYLPEKSVPFQSEFATMKAEPTLLSGKARTENINKNRTKLSFTVVNTEGHSVIQLPYFAYPGYAATLRENGNTATSLELCESEYGLWSIAVPEHTNGEVSLAYTGTKATRLGFTISLAACALLPLYILTGVFLSHRRKPPPLSGKTTAG